jgi:cytochrome c-type biogenesis protein CcmF
VARQPWLGAAGLALDAGRLTFPGTALLLGGYWGWDPVENSSLVSWLTTTALLYAMLVQRAHGGLRRATFTLAILTYVLVFYATFLTRSGVLSNSQPIRSRRRD